MTAVDPTVTATFKPARVSLETPTETSLAAEAAALGDAYPEVTAHPADLLADAEEMLQGKKDAKELKDRGYAISDGVFTRIELLAKVLTPLTAQQTRQAEASKLKTADADAARERLLQLRSEIGRIGIAAGLPAGVFSLETNRTQRLNVVMMKMEEVLLNVRAYWVHLPDQKRLEGLMAEARALIDAQKAARQDARLLRSDRTVEGRKAGRYERLLLNVLQHVSAQGVAAFPNDVTRETIYRLDHVNGRKASRVADPGAGKDTGQPVE